MAAILITRTVVKPLSAVVSRLDELACGRLDVKIGNTEQGDEIGARHLFHEQAEGIDHHGIGKAGLELAEDMVEDARTKR